MLDAKRIMKKTVRSNEVTFATHKPASQGKCIDPYKPFKGVDGKTYTIGYNSSMNMGTNCYSFAMGWFLSGVMLEDYNPGFLTGKPFELDKLEELIRSDLETVNRKVLEVVYDIPKNLPTGEGYWIKALHCKENGEYSVHFMRKDVKSGRWIHKVGWEMPPKVLVKHTKYEDKKDMLMDMPGIKGTSPMYVERLLKLMFPEQLYSGKIPVEDAIEEDDSASYESITEYDQIQVYAPLFAMRISD